MQTGNKLSNVYKIPKGYTKPIKQKNRIFDQQGKKESSKLKQVFDRLYKNNISNEDIKKELKLGDSDNAEQFSKMLKNLTSYKSKLKKLSALKSFFNSNLTMSLYNKFEPTFLTNDYLMIQTSLYQNYFNFFKELSNDSHDIIIDSIGYYSNTILYLKDEPDPKTKVIPKYPYLKYFIEDYDLDFCCNYVYLNYDQTKFKIVDIYSFNDYSFYIYKYPFEEIKKDTTQYNDIIKNTDKFGSTNTAIEYINFYNQNKLDAIFIYKTNEKNWDLSNEDTDIFRIWDSITIYSMNRSDKKYSEDITPSKLKGGVYFYNCLIKPTYSIPETVIFPNGDILGIESVCNLSIPTGIYFNKLYDNDYEPYQIHEIFYNLENIEALQQIAYVFSFINPDFFLNQKANVTYGEFNKIVTNAKTILGHYKRLWALLVKICKLFLDATKNKIDGDKLIKSFNLCIQWIDSFAKLYDNVRENGVPKDNYTAFINLKLPEVTFINGDGEYLINSIFKFCSMLDSKTIPKDFDLSQIENLLRGILVNIRDNFKINKYNKDSSNIETQGILPIYRSTYAMFGNLVGANIPEVKDKTEEEVVKELYTNYKTLLNNFMSKEFKKLEQQREKKEELNEAAEKGEKDGITKLLKDNYEFYKRKDITAKTFAELCAKYNIIPSKINCPIDPADYVDDIKKLFEKDGEKEVKELETNIKAKEAELDDLKAKKVVAEDKLKVVKDIAAAVVIINADISDYGFTNRAYSNYYTEIEYSLSMANFKTAITSEIYYNMNRSFNGKAAAGDIDNPIYSPLDFINAALANKGFSDAKDKDIYLDNIIKTYFSEFLENILSYDPNFNKIMRFNNILLPYIQLQFLSVAIKTLKLGSVYENHVLTTIVADHGFYYKFSNPLPIMLLYSKLPTKNDSYIDRPTFLYLFFKKNVLNDLAGWYKNAGLTDKLPVLKTLETYWAKGKSNISNINSTNMFGNDVDYTAFFNKVKDANDKLFAPKPVVSSVPEKSKISSGPASMEIDTSSKSTGIVGSP